MTDHSEAAVRFDIGHKAADTTVAKMLAHGATVEAADELQTIGALLRAATKSEGPIEQGMMRDSTCKARAIIRFDQ